MTEFDGRGERGVTVKTSIRDLAQFRRRLLEWFGRRKRDLPWRRTSDPYRIWISEIMLQQTRVAAVIPYYERFVRRFPSVRALAKAPQNEVLRLWAGLGYYSRARNLHRAAKEIVARHGGKFPRDLDAALALPGIGRYSAAAVLSIAYSAPLAVLDGNVARVLARLGAIRGDLRAPRRWAELQRTAQELLAARAPGDWNQAMMELGATVCTPRSPKCGECPVARGCKALRDGIAEAIPAARIKRAPEKVQIAAAVLLDPRGRTLLLRYSNGHPGEEDALFSRMWQFPALKVTAHAARKLREHLAAEFGVHADGAKALPRARHSVTFREVTLLPSLLRVDFLPRSPAKVRANKMEFRTPRLSALSALPISNATRKIAEAALHAIAR
jgi:A/G-specific adenine glycosylase